MALSRLGTAPLRASHRLARTASPLRGLSDASAAHKAASPTSGASPLRATRSTEVELDQSLGRSLGSTVHDPVSSCSHSAYSSASPSHPAAHPSLGPQTRIDHLVLHFDINKTIVMMDSVTGKTEVRRSAWSVCPPTSRLT